MTPDNHRIINELLYVLRETLVPFIENVIEQNGLARFTNHERYFIKLQTPNSFSKPDTNPVSELDVATLLKLMWERDNWNQFFLEILDWPIHPLLHELRNDRDKWAHWPNNGDFSADDVYRTMNSVERLLTAIDVPQSEEMQKLKTKVWRVLFNENDVHLNEYLAEKEPSRQTQQTEQ